MKQAIKHFRDTSPLMEPVCRALRATGVLPERIWRHLAFKGVIDFEVGGRKVKMNHIGAEVENTLFWCGYGNGWEGTTVLVWEQLAAESRVIFDVGANSGTFALAAKAASPEAKVHAFEPLPKIADLLAANVALNGFDITVHRSAASDHAGSARIRIAEWAHEYSASFEHMEWMDGQPIIEIEVPLERLADVASVPGNRPDLIKLDVERHEPQALRGLWDAFKEGPLPAMVVEVLDDETAALVEAEIAPRGYRTYAIREMVGVREEKLRAIPGAMNWLLLPAGSDLKMAGLLRTAGSIVHSDLVQSHSLPVR